LIIIRNQENSSTQKTFPIIVVENYITAIETSINTLRPFRQNEIELRTARENYEIFLDKKSSELINDPLLKAADIYIQAINSAHTQLSEAKVALAKRDLIIQKMYGFSDLELLRFVATQEANTDTMVNPH
jgi:hypothetical protein